MDQEVAKDLYQGHDHRQSEGRPATKWKITHQVQYGDQEWKTIEEVVVSTARMAERAAKRIAKGVVACDDERFDGPGTPVATLISITPMPVVTPG